jgi:AcrR family transcriptional regulator
MNTSASEQSHPVDQARRALGQAALHLLSEMPFAELDLDQIIAATEVEADLAKRLYQDKLEVVETGLANFDSDLAETLALDIAEDHISTVREKIFEGLIQRFEAYRSHKAAIRALNAASVSNPKVALIMVNRLNHAMAQLLEVTGGGGVGLIGRMRAKGLTGVCLAVLKDWLRDDTPDMSETTRLLDQRLKQAESLATSFGIIPAQNPEQDDPEQDNPEAEHDSQF